MPTRTHALLVAGAMMLCLLAGSEPRLLGDGPEYVAQALNFARLDGPSIGRRESADLERRIGEIDPAFAGWDLNAASVMGADSRRDFLHFWLYALTVAPAMAVMDLTGFPVLLAFTVTNVAFFGLALSVAVPRIGPWASLLLFASPVVWWIDKPHTEVFTFSLLTVALLIARDRPGWAMVAAGAAAAQNPPIAIVPVLIGALSIGRRPALVGDRRFVAGAVVGLGLAALHPVYSYARHATPSLLIDATNPGMPPLAEWLAVPFDLTIGLLGNFPVLLLVLVVAAVLAIRRDWHTLLTTDAAVAALSAPAFLYAFARAANVHHGATPSLSRYGLWLLPLSVPLLATVMQHGGDHWRRFLRAAAVVSAAASVVAFHPGVEENSREPTWAAAWAWTSHPAWSNPLPEIFTETIVQEEALVVPVATAGCEKVLLASPNSGSETAWPIPCSPARLPAECLAPGVLCYANWNGTGYDFARTKGRRNTSDAVPSTQAWTAAMAPHVRRVYGEHGWRGAVPPRHDPVALRQYQDVRVLGLGDDRDFLLVLRPVGEAPVLRFRFTQPAIGHLIDPATGRTLDQFSASGDSSELRTVDLHPAVDLMVLSVIGDERR